MKDIKCHAPERISKLKNQKYKSLKILNLKFYNLSKKITWKVVMKYKNSTM